MRLVAVVSNAQWWCLVPSLQWPVPGGWFPVSTAPCQVSSVWRAVPAASDQSGCGAKCPMPLVCVLFAQFPVVPDACWCPRIWEAKRSQEKLRSRRGPGSQPDGKPGNQEAWKPRSQEAGNPRRREAGMARRQEVGKPRSTFTFLLSIPFFPYSLLSLFT